VLRQVATFPRNETVADCVKTQDRNGNKQQQIKWHSAQSKYFQIKGEFISFFRQDRRPESFHTVLKVYETLIWSAQRSRCVAQSLFEWIRALQPHFVLGTKDKDRLALQLRFLFQMGAFSGGLVGASPERPSDDKGRLDALLREARGNAANLLDRPMDEGWDWL
jgi:hypothetical protein